MGEAAAVPAAAARWMRLSGAVVLGAVLVLLAFLLPPLVGSTGGSPRPGEGGHSPPTATSPTTSPTAGGHTPPAGGHSPPAAPSR